LAFYIAALKELKLYQEIKFNLNLNKFINIFIIWP